MQEFAYSNQPVILLYSSLDPRASQDVHRRLATYFQMHQDAVKFVDSNGISAFFAPGAYLVDYGPACISDESSFVATASPVFDRGVASDASAALLSKYAEDVVKGRIGADELPTPMSLFRATFADGRGWASNDSFGMGRLYYVEGNDFAAVSNNIAALALSQPGRSEVDLDYWDAYYSSGGGVGRSTYVKGVSRARGGTVAQLYRGKLTLTESLPLESVLLRSRDRQPDYSAPVASALNMIDNAKPFFADKLGIGLSGGRDSRLVTALALHAGLNFTSFTAIPPELEGDIARKLNRASRIPFTWEQRDSRVSKRSAAAAPVELPPILERAENWFAFTGGDNWPTYVRKSHVRNRRIRLGSMALSGAFGDFTRGHYYTAKEAADGDSASAINRFYRGLTSSRKLIPVDVRERGAVLVKETFDEMRETGFSGFNALDLSFLVNRMRRQLPHPAPNTLLPMLTPQMLSEVFWNDPVQKLDASGLREMTSELMPEWSAIPYFHEAAVGTDPAVTNKVSIQPTYWEVDEADFMTSVEQSLRVNEYFDISMDSVRSEIADLPEGRNRTNTTFEFMFWHAGGSSLLARVNEAKTWSLA